MIKIASTEVAIVEVDHSMLNLSNEGESFENNGDSLAAATCADMCRLDAISSYSLTECPRVLEEAEKESDGTELGEERNQTT